MYILSIISITVNEYYCQSAVLVSWKKLKKRRKKKWRKLLVKFVLMFWLMFLNFLPLEAGCYAQLAVTRNLSSLEPGYFTDIHHNLSSLIIVIHQIRHSHAKRCPGVTTIPENLLKCPGKGKEKRRHSLFHKSHCVEEDRILSEELILYLKQDN